MILILLLILCGAEPGVIEVMGKAQGTTYSIKYISTEAVVSKAEVDSLFRAVDLSLSLYEPSSLISFFNARGRVKMDVHLRSVVAKAMEVNQQSMGAFDVTSKPLTDLWRDAERESKKPSSGSIKKVMALVGGGGLLMRDDSLWAVKKGIRIDCDGIAQGYTVDLISSFLDSKGVDNYIVELGGEVKAKGYGPGVRSWAVGIESPSVLAGEWHAVIRNVKLNNKAITTSGNYRKYIMVGNTRYGHVMDPGTGYPVENGIISVTVVANTAMDADAWDNGFFVLGVERSLQLLRQRADLHAYFIFRDARGNLRDTASSGFYDLMR